VEIDLEAGRKKQSLYDHRIRRRGHVLHTTEGTPRMGGSSVVTRKKNAVRVYCTWYTLKRRLSVKGNSTIARVSSEEGKIRTRNEHPT